MQVVQVQKLQYAFYIQYPSPPKPTEFINKQTTVKCRNTVPQTAEYTEKKDEEEYHLEEKVRGGVCITYAIRKTSKQTAGFLGCIESAIVMTISVYVKFIAIWVEKIPK